MTEADRFRTDLARIAGDIPNPLLLAVSGGPDSMAMLALAAAALPGGITAATVDHGLRPDAAGEAAMVAAACAALNVPHITLTAAEPPAGASLQAQARGARYALLTAHARAIGAAAVATAHHADDQAETFLMRAARGSGLSGLAGVRTRVVIDGVTIVRPLLDWRRAELRAIARRAEMPFVDDPANADDRHDRTRFRRLLGANEWLDPPRLARAAAALAEADADLRAVADWIWDARAAVHDGAVVTLAIDDLPRGLLRVLARRAIAAVRDSGAITTPDWSEAMNVEPLLDALAQGRRATQAGVVAGMRRGVWRFRPAPPRRRT
ncbi:tRNA lysidine(34) synthetase TilS [Sphingomonas sp.]|jgi:tRNA(Ile)-lysidine synthase|uniref:tRNA lysidine(34) synthetase TilS n=1 Tax=Sphingomonas sp. TaxID=28214 RepID=UPI002ED99814